jgi:hypothetical protein
MLVERLITTQIGTSDTNILYSSDINADLIKLLQQKYGETCFKRCFIKNIISIEELAPTILDPHRPIGNATITLTFKAQAVVYDTNEVIPAAKIIQIMDNGRIVLKTDIATIMLMPNQLIQHYKVDDIVPVRVVQSRYKVGYKNIAIQAIPFLPLKDETYHFISNAIESPEISKKIEAQYKLISEYDKKSIKLWEDVLFPKKINTANNKFKLTEITKLKGKTGYIYMPIDTSGECYFDENGESDPKLSSVVYQSVQLQLLKNLNLLLDFIAAYGDQPDKKLPWYKIL